MNVKVVLLLEIRKCHIFIRLPKCYYFTVVWMFLFFLSIFLQINLNFCHFAYNFLLHCMNTIINIDFQSQYWCWMFCMEFVYWKPTISVFYFGQCSGRRTLIVSQSLVIFQEDKKQLHLSPCEVFVSTSLSKLVISICKMLYQ